MSEIARYMPLFALFSPFGNIICILTNKSNEPKPSTLFSPPQLDLLGHLTVSCGAIRSFLVALFLVYGLYDKYSYPAFIPNISLSLDWMVPIIIRDLFGTILICGIWDYILYFSPFSQKLKKYKFNKEYPTRQQFQRDIFWTIISSLNAACIEICLCYLWSNGYLKYDSKSLLNNLIKNALWIVTITHWRAIHFWFIHRMIHPWKTDNIPDIGKILYKYIHSLHHKSYNPTTFSGTSMHPIESILYYSAALCCIPFGCHPLVSVSCLVDLSLGAFLAHDGFQFPGTGSYFHQLHHEHYDCNYGANEVPIDKWFGTYIGKPEDLKRYTQSK